MRIQKLSIIIPCYNEIGTIAQALARIRSVDFRRAREIIVVDDCSTDGSREFLKEFSKKTPDDIRVLFHENNQGKGAAIQTALLIATGEYVIVQDADLEYDPHDIARIIDRAEEIHASVVYGSRNMTGRPPCRYPLFYWGIFALTCFINMRYRQKITDPETCYKLVRADLLRSLMLREQRFCIEMEITIKLCQLNILIPEIPIAYVPRSFREGKKITIRDGIEAGMYVFRSAWRTLI